ncbi:YheC/YheD family protein [Bacillus sp. H-16]|uniref:YheC/YheD family endospore coat-associated protein n=1 Tax=Alteribacter salitolerans TaxID=2912333 RepID=UPI00196630B7|nr:YheC/YheD family protein [Alteribacter salitolerans]MBM7097371.1 YheC/YheD family protein [Alteribacter salitolerans]
MSLVTFGILQLEYDQEKEYVTQIALEASLKNVTLHLFTPFDWDEESNVVNGMKFDKKSLSFMPSTFLLPKVIYDRCFYGRSELARKAAPLVREIKDKSCFLGYGLPDKWKVNEILKLDSSLCSLLPETKLLRPSTLISMLKEHRDVILKPVAGSGGKGIHLITRKKGMFVWTNAATSKKVVHEVTPVRLYEELKRRTGGLPYLIQPFLSLTDKNNSPFDLRIVLRKNAKGKWTELGRGIRTGAPGTFVSNLASGGSITPYEGCIVTEKQKEVLEMVISKIGFHLEESHPRLFELGIDIGLDKEGNVWILEVNSKPGFQTVLFTSDQNGRRAVYQGPVESYLRIKKQVLNQKKKRNKGAAVTND